MMSLSLPERATEAARDMIFLCRIQQPEARRNGKDSHGHPGAMEPEWVLHLYPRSGLGFKYRLQLNNTVGIIDSDYFNSDNEGHIFAKITNDSNEGKTLKLQAGEGFMQGIFLEYGITEDDDADGARNGGFGSTGR